MRSSKIIDKVNDQKQMAKSDSLHKFHDLEYFELIIFSIFLEVIIFLGRNPKITILMY